MKKTSTLYIVMLSIWAIIMSALWYSFIKSFINLDKTLSLYPLILLILILNAVFISYFWLNGTKDIIYVIWTFILKKYMLKKYDTVKKCKLNTSPKVILLYCTCNDFDKNSLLKSMKQNYSNYETVILDDSNQQSYINKIDFFSKKHNISVIRRKNRIGFKAGNINNYMLNKTDYDYMVILDSDEIIPPYFITESLKYFQTYHKLGILQANHISSRNRNQFMETFHIGVNSHWPNYQTTKNFSGFMSMLGHGAMISKTCYSAVGGFPHVVAEDLCLSIEAKNKGFEVIFAPNIICEEEYPIDYLAFRKRHSKWTQGNLEFIKKYTKKIIKSQIKWYEKIDIFLFTYNLPLTAVFSIFLLLNIVFLPLLNYSFAFPLWMLVPTTVFFIAPMLNDFFTYVGKLNTYKLIKYLLLCFCLYGSMFYVSLVSSFKGLLGKKAVFIVTPKTNEHITFTQSIRYCYKEIIFALILIVCSILCSHSISGIVSVIALAIPSLISPYLCIMGNTKKNENESLTPSRIVFNNKNRVAIRNPIQNDNSILPQMTTIEHYDNFDKNENILT